MVVSPRDNNASYVILQEPTTANALLAVPPPPLKGGKWFGGGSNQHASYMLTYRLNAERRCRSLCPDQVDHLCNSFQSAWSQQEAADKEAQWHVAIRLHEAICMSSATASCPQSTISKLADHFYRLEQNGRYISRANFVRCARQVHGGARLTKCLDDVFSAFDPRNRNQVDWRIILFSIFIASRPLQSCRDVLWNAFRFYVGEAGNIIDCPPSSIILRDLHLVLSPLVRVESLSVVLNRFDNAWMNVANASTQDTRKYHHSALLLTLNSFEQILDDPSIKSLFEDTIVVGNGSPLDFNLCAFEYKNYPQTLLHHIKKSRKALAIATFGQDHDMAQMKAALYQWKLFCSRRRHARELVDTMAHRLWHERSMRGFWTLHRWAMRQVAAAKIQRVLRGFLGRVDAGVRRAFTRSSVLLQSCARRYLQRCRYLYFCELREHASIAIQRIVRGNRDRRIAISALLARIGKERLELEVAMMSFEHHRQTRAAIVIQRLHRSCSSRQETWKRLCREAKAREELEGDRMQFRRERRIYEQELKEFYDTKKREEEEADASKARSDRERIRIRNLQRRIIRDDLNRAIEVKSSLDMRNEKQDAAKYQDDWSSLIESKAMEYKEFCSRCLQDPRNTKERKTRSTLTTKIKKRIRDVLKRADAQGLRIEIVEAKQIATKEILELEASQEKNRLTEQWHLDAMERTRQRKIRREEEIRRAREKKGLNEQRAILLLSRAYRRWSARKVLRTLCCDRFDKEFDVEYHAFYYVDRRTGIKTWEKPKSLGDSDIPIKDEWKVLRDAQGFPYYYNPCTREMSWHPPSGAAMCPTIVPQPWLQEYPVPFGPCEFFAVTDGQLCERCSSRDSNTLAT